MSLLSLLASLPVSRETYLAIGACLVTALVWWLRETYGEKRTVLRNGQVLVRPARWPIIGIAHRVTTDTMIDVLDDLVRENGDLVEVYIGTKRMILIADPDTAKEVLFSRPKVFRRPHAFEPCAKAVHFDRSVFFAEGHDWNVLRKSTSPSFNKHNVDSHLTAVWRTASHWARGLRRDAEEAATTTAPAPLDLKTETLRFTLRVITQVAFGIDETQKDSYFHSDAFRDDLQSLFTFLIERFVFPLPAWTWSIIPSLYRCEVAARAAEARLATACRAVIATRREAFRVEKEQEKQEDKKTEGKAPKADKTLLDTLLLKTQSETLSDDDVVQNVKTFYLAGSETTSIALAQAVRLLCLPTHAHVLRRLREEVDRFVALADKSEREGETAALDMESVLTSLAYTEAVVKETLRMCGPATLLVHNLVDDAPHTLSNGLTVRATDDVVAHVDGIHWSERLFENAREFVPERWLDEDAEKRARCESHFVAFGAGPRVCPGQRLAMVEGTLGLAALVREVDFALACDPREIRRVLQFTSVPDKMPVFVTPRKM